jgi:hypothetical protein
VFYVDACWLLAKERKKIFDQQPKCTREGIIDHGLIHYQELGCILYLINENGGIL